MSDLILNDYGARGDFVILRRVKKSELVRSLHIPENTAGGMEYYVHSVGPKVEDLKAGDEVMFLGAKDGNYFDIPNEPSLFFIKECFIPYKIKKKSS